MTESETVAADIERDVQGYNSAFVESIHSRNPSLMREWMRLPVTLFGNGVVRTLATPEDIDAQYGAGADALRETDYKISVLSDFAIDLLNSTTALVKCRAVRYRSDDSVIAAFDACYIVVRGDDRWQIASLISRR